MNPWFACLHCMSVDQQAAQEGTHMTWTCQYKINGVQQLVRNSKTIFFPLKHNYPRFNDLTIIREHGLRGQNVQIKCIILADIP